MTTPRTDAQLVKWAIVGEGVSVATGLASLVPSDFARQLELEAESLSRRVAELEAVVEAQHEALWNVGSLTEAKRLYEALQRKDGQ